MARPRKLTPSYLRHKQTGRGRLVWTDSLGIHHECMLPGEYGSKESLEAKARQELELAIAPPKAMGANPAVSVSELLLAHLEYADRHYRGPDGRPTDEVRQIKAAVRYVRELYGETTAVEFGPLALKAVRAKMVAAGWCRKSVNARVERIRRAFKWACSEEILPAEVYQRLQSVEGLRIGRTTAADHPPVKPAVMLDVEKAMPFMPPPVAALATLQIRSAARAGELVRLRAADIDRIDPDVWTYSPVGHKGTWRGKSRTIYFGEKCRAVLAPFILKAGDPQAYLFSPARAEAERNAERSAARVVPLYPSHARRNELKRKGERRKRAPADRYTTGTYRRAIERACEKAGVPVFTPHQLRHLAATTARAEFGVDVARALCGHSLASVTEIYSGEVDKKLAMQAARKLG